MSLFASPVFAIGTISFPGLVGLVLTAVGSLSDQGLFFFLENISCMSVFVAFLRLLFLNLTESALLKQGQIWQPYMGQS